jgi:hypothetical protein
LPDSSTRLDRFQALGWRRGAWLHQASELAVKGRYREADLRQSLLRHRCKKIDVAHDHRRFCDDHHRMVAGLQHFEYLAHDPPFLLDRLVGIGVGADCDWPHLVAGFCQFAFKQLCRIRFGIELGLEI